MAGERLDVGQHERGRVVDLVRHARGQHAYRRELLGLQAPDLSSRSSVGSRTYSTAPRPDSG